MEILRTPDERFANLPGYSFRPNYADAGGLRVHYLDEGPSSAAPVLLMHGEPSWSYLYRKMIPVLTGAGQRVVAPDLPGFGRSDKPARLEDHTYKRHVDWMAAVMERLDLRNITMVGQDWGGLIGLRLAAEHPERFSRIVVANTGLPTGDQPMSEAFLQWRKFSRESPVFVIGRIVQSGCLTPLAPEVVAAYEAPFPDDRYMAGARQMPSLVPISPDDPAAAANRMAWEVFSRWEKPFLTAFSDGDPITGGGAAVFQRLVPGAKNRSHVTIKGGGHFLQEDKGEELARVVADFIATT
jgi:haloalkane dehalogenase